MNHPSLKKFNSQGKLAELLRLPRSQRTVPPSKNVPSDDYNEPYAFSLPPELWYEILEFVISIDISAVRLDHTSVDNSRSLGLHTILFDLSEPSTVDHAVEFAVKSMASCLRVCRTWYEISLPMLYSRLNLHKRATASS